ncbi:DUF3080 family protein [Rhodanobacter aciditrophus]|uniref:DUF3080 family protein n=1 Tax=Rhodanobacter aciditrophus TaxID=1623218 RepID=A0ABW4AWW5_9GAMM
MTSRISFKALGLLLLLVLNGCDSRYQAQTMFDAYVNDLNRSNRVSIELGSKPELLPLPALRERKAELSQFDVGLLDFLSLQRCEVGALAGQRNSILGKVMATSQRFVYELEIIRAIQSCDIEDEELRTTLAHVAMVKTKELPLAFSNMLWAGEETSTFFSLANGYVPTSPEASQYQQLIIALQTLASIESNLADVPKVTSEQVEGQMKAVYQSEYLGKWLYSVSYISWYLNAVSDQIERLAFDEAVCGAPIQFLKQQFEAHYIDRLQPYMARINRGAYQVLPLTEQLINSSPLESPSWRSFIQQFSMTSESAPWQHYLAASRRHGQAWSRLFALCRQEPG